MSVSSLTWTHFRHEIFTVFFSKSDDDDYDDGDGFFYNPELGDLPDFEMLPDILDLPNVAQVKRTCHKTYEN